MRLGWRAVKQARVSPLRSLPLSHLRCTGPPDRPTQLHRRRVRTRTRAGRRASRFHEAEPPPSPPLSSFLCFFFCGFAPPRCTRFFSNADLRRRRRPPRTHAHTHTHTPPLASSRRLRVRLTSCRPHCTSTATLACLSLRFFGPRRRPHLLRQWKECLLLSFRRRCGVGVGVWWGVAGGGSGIDAAARTTQESAKGAHSPSPLSLTHTRRHRPRCVTRRGKPGVDGEAATRVEIRQT